MIWGEEWRANAADKTTKNSSSHDFQKYLLFNSTSNTTKSIWSGKIKLVLLWLDDGGQSDTRFTNLKIAPVEMSNELLLLWDLPGIRAQYVVLQLFSIRYLRAQAFRSWVPKMISLAMAKEWLSAHNSTGMTTVSAHNSLTGTAVSAHNSLTG